MMNVEEDCIHILHTLETVVLQQYRKNPALTDYEVLRAYETTIMFYTAQQKNQDPKLVALSPLEQTLYDSISITCRECVDGKGIFRSEPVGVDVIIACLKRLRKSVNMWTKNYGRQGYLNYIRNFIPG